MASADTFEAPPSMRARWVLIPFVAMALLVLWCRPASAAPSGFTFCANELAYCELSGTDAFITFGAGEGACDLTAGTCTGSYSAPIRYSTGFSNTCRGDVLGLTSDPAPGVAKACFWISAGGATPPPDPASVPASSPTVNPWEMPSSAELGAAFSWGLTGVLFCYLCAWAAGRVLDAIRG